MKQYRLATLLSAIVCAGITAEASALTPVSAPPAGEKSHEQILEDIFGGDFMQVGSDFTDGLLTLTRVDDDADQSYNFASWSVQAHAVWAGASQSFGTLADGALFTASSSANNASGSAVGLNGGQGIIFGRFGSGSHTSDVYTDPSLNPGGRDHVVTYQYLVADVNGPVASYLLFFEDRSELSGRSDWDYNDLVVELRGTSIDSGALTPEPGSLALLGLGTLALFRRRRHDES